MIETQQNTIDNKNKQIELLDKQRIILENTLQNRDKELGDLYEQLQGLTNNLGPDAQDQAPDSIKELFKRLQ